MIIRSNPSVSKWYESKPKKNFDLLQWRYNLIIYLHGQTRKLKWNDFYFLCRASTTNNSSWWKLFDVISTYAFRWMRKNWSILWLVKSSHPEVFLGKGVLKICSKFTREHPCRSAISKAALQLYWNRASAWVFYRKFAAYFQNTFPQEHLWRAASD